MKKVLDLRSLFVISLLLTAPSALLSQETVLEKSISIKRTTAVPEIDGVIEEIWQQADSVSDFVQNRPYENAQPSERTVAYLMQDDENLYVAFRCYSQKNPPTKSYTKDEDYVLIGIDPMGSRTGGYFFWQYASGIFWDGMYTDDGRSMDLAWEGVWYQAVKVHPDRMDMEFKIPFKTIRYKKGLSEWGLQLRRHIAENFEDDSWVPVPQRDNDLISRWGKPSSMARMTPPRSSILRK